MISLRIRVTHYLGVPPTQNLAADFTGAGGTIGRHADCTLVLPDPARHVSRIQASIQIGQNFAIVTSTSDANPVIVAGRAVPMGEAVQVRAGESFHIAGYDLSVETVRSPPQNAKQQTSAHRQTTTPPSASAIPDDFDPFAPHADAASAPAPVVVPTTAHPLAAPPPEPEHPAPARAHRGAFIPDDAIDHLFKPAGKDALSTRDPFADPPSPTGLAAPDAGLSLDPMARFTTPPPPVGAPSAADHGSELNAAFRLPTRVPGDTQSQRDRASESNMAPVGPAAVRPTPSDAVVPKQDVQALLDALLTGAGLPGSNQRSSLPMPRLTPALMEHLGRLLRAATEGLVALDQARTTFKQEVRAEVTVIGAQANNPIRFAPDPATALKHLLHPDALPGFLDPVSAVTATCDDLVAHQIAQMSAMQAAMASAIARFEPAVLEERLGDKSLLESMLLTNRRARLWELFTQEYARVSGDARHDFERVFGAAFVAAYEAQIESLTASRDMGSRP